MEFFLRRFSGQSTVRERQFNLSLSQGFTASAHRPAIAQTSDLSATTRSHFHLPMSLGSSMALFPPAPAAGAAMLAAYPTATFPPAPAAGAAVYAAYPSSASLSPTSFLVLRGIHA